MPEVPEDVAQDEDQIGDEMVEIFNAESEKRLWVRAILPLIQTLKNVTVENQEVKRHIECAVIQGCLRVERILRSDIPPMEFDE